MPTRLHITTTLQITPLIDLQHEDVATAYRRGVSDSLRHRDAPIPLVFLLTSLQRAIASGVFDGQHEADVLQFVGSFLGSVHGAILTAYGTHRLNATTLISLDSKDARRGYRAGRRWFMEEASDDERHFTDEKVLAWFTETVQECDQDDGEGVWAYTLATLFGELSGPLFPLTRQERARWDEDDRRVLAKMARQEAQHRQRDTEPLPARPASPGA